jgi:hypothetical protein
VQIIARISATLRWLKADLDAAADQRGGDIGLQVGKSQHQIGLQGQDRPQGWLPGVHPGVHPEAGGLAGNPVTTTD